VRFVRNSVIADSLTGLIVDTPYAAAYGPISFKRLAGGLIAAGHSC